MKIKTLYIKKFKGLSDFSIDFNDNVTVIIGENGTGKTTILETIYNMLKVGKPPHTNSHGTDTIFMKKYPNIFDDESFHGSKALLSVDKEMESIEKLSKRNSESLVNIVKHKVLELDIVKTAQSQLSCKGDWHMLRLISLYLEDENEVEPHVLYLPTEINFTKYKPENIKKTEQSLGFGVILNSETISIELKDFLVYQHYKDLEDKDTGGAGTRIEKYKDLFNSFFEDKEFIGIKDLEPLFKTKTGETHSVDELSSGEKQIFFRAGSILEYNVQNSIILLDEPEISMHPEWQQKILAFYKKVAGNNQLIIATHSPHIISSCKRDEVRVLEKENGRVKVKENIDNTYGHTIDQLLLSIFNINSVRDINVQQSLDRLKELYVSGEKIDDSQKNELETLKNELTSFLNPNDPELSLISVDVTTEKLKKLLKDLETKNA